MFSDIVGCVLCIYIYIHTQQYINSIFTPISQLYNCTPCLLVPSPFSRPYPIGQWGKDRKLDTIGMLENHRFQSLWCRLLSICISYHIPYPHLMVFLRITQDPFPTEVPCQSSIESPCPLISMEMCNKKCRPVATLRAHGFCSVHLDRAWVAPVGIIDTKPWFLGGS